MEGQVIVQNEETALKLVAEKPFTFYTAITRIEGHVDFDKLVDEAKVFEKDFQIRLLRNAEEEGKTEELLDFVQKHVSDEGSMTVYSTDEDSEEYGEGQELTKENIDDDSEAYEEDQKLTKENLDDVAWLKLPFAAVTENRFDILDLCIRSVDDFNTFRWIKRMNLLMFALNQSTVSDDMVDYLLTHLKADYVTENGDTALNICLSNKKLDVNRKLQLARRLIEVGVPVNSSKLVSASGLHSYVDSYIGAGEEEMIRKQKDFVDLLLDAGQNINQKDWLDQTPLMVILPYIPPLEPEMNENELQIRNEKISLAKYLLLKGADPNIKDNAGRNCVHIAVTSQSDDVLKIIIKSGGDVNAQDNLGMTPAYMICCNADWSRDCDVQEILSPIIHSLAEAGCDFNIKGIDQSTVLHFAAVKGSLEMCRLLVSVGSNVHSKDYLKRSPLHMAARNANCEISAFLIKNGADMNCRDINSSTPLHIASLYNNTGAAKVLVGHGADIFAKGDFEIQPIHLAAENGTSDLLQYMSAIADVTARDMWGAIPLHYAASDGNYEAVELFKSNGINIDTTDTTGKTALDLAIYRGHLKAAKILTQSNSDPVFGKLPPNLFPNRPLVSMHNIDKYFDDVAELFKRHRLEGHRAVEAIMESKGLGPTDLKSGEGREISDNIIKLAEDILIQMQELNPLFRCKLLNAGSSSEGVKVGYPNEFDFIFNVESVSEYVERLDQGDTAGFARVVIKDSSPENIKKFCLRSSNVLNAAYFLRYFGKICCKATYDVLSSGKHKFYTGNMLLREYGPLFSDSSIPWTKLMTFTFSYRGKDNKLLDVSVDFNPVLHFHDIPKELNLDSTLLSDADRMGTYVIPKYCRKVHGYPKDTIPFTSDLWRYSTHHLEAVVLKSLPQSARYCLMLCKALRMEPMTCSVENEPIFKHESMGSKVQTDTQETQSEMIHRELEDITKNTHNQSVDSDYHGEGDNDPQMMLNPTLHASAAAAAADDDDDDDEDDDDDDDGDVDGGGEGEEEEEITAEQAIPSYYLKIIFIKEMEEMNKKGLVFDYCDIPAMVKRVYTRLEQALEAKDLRSLFLPEHNELQNVEKYDSTRQMLLEMRCKYCRNIVNLLDRLGFSDTL